jgi:hypothetical protein
VGPKAILDVYGEAKIPLPLQGIEPQFQGCPCRGLVAILLTLSWLHIQGTGVFVFLLLVPFFHSAVILHESEGEKVGIFE